MLAARSQATPRRNYGLAAVDSPLQRDKIWEWQLGSTQHLACMKSIMCH